MASYGRGGNRGSQRGFAPRGRGTSQFRGSNRPFATSTNATPGRDLHEGLFRTSIQTVSKPTVSDIEVVNIQIGDLTYLGSYNWIDGERPTIIVPGSPPQWKNKALPYAVQADTGTQYADQNGFKMGTQTLLPLFRAVDITSEVHSKVSQVDWSSVDFVTDRNGLRKLLRWVNHKPEGEPMKEFRIDSQLAGKRTVLFNRWEMRTTEQFSGVTFGFNFEKASTTPAPGCEGSTGHHRIIKYDLDGITLVVRFEVDACVATQTKPPRKSAGDVDDLSSLLSGLAVSSTPSATSSSRAAASTNIRSLTVIRAGAEVPQGNILELTTRSERNAENFDWGESYPQLYLSQTPHLYLAVHSRGKFMRVQKEKLGSSKMIGVERSLQVGLKKLRAALETIQDLVIDHGKDGRISFLCQDGELRAYERESRATCLPEDVIARFEA